MPVGVNGLCVISSRESVTDLEDKHGTTVREVKLDHLSHEAGAELLKDLGVQGSPDDMKLHLTDYYLEMYRLKGMDTTWREQRNWLRLRGISEERKKLQSTKYN